MNQNTKLKWLLIVGALLPLAALAQVDVGIKAKAAFDEEDPRDLGEPPPATPPQDKHRSEYLDLNPYLHVQFDPDNALYSRVQLFGTAGDPVFQNESERAVASKNFAALRELYYEHGNIAGLPGQAFRLGMQRVKDDDGLWWDRDIESIRWLLDSTLLQSQFAIAEQFSTYRTDDVKLTPSQRHRAYAFASLGDQWQPGYFNAIHITYAQDHEALPDVGSTIDSNSKVHERKYLWLGLITHNGYYDPRSPILVHYWLQAVGLGGRRETAQTNPLDPVAPNQVIGQISDKVAAGAADAALRVRLPLIFPLEFGVAGAYAGGDPGGSGTSHVFEPTGLESNRSRYTGSRTLMNRFSEALQAHWSNLRNAAAEMSVPWSMGDLSAVYQRFERDNGNASFVADGIDIQPVNTSRDIGRTVDVVITTFIPGFSTAYAASGSEDQDSNVRVRAARFYPGEAYGPGASALNRVALEVTLWF